MIKRSFKKGGINLKFDGTEDIHFDWPKSPNMLLVEKLPNLTINNNIENYMELNIKENNISNESDNDDDILFNYERYSLKEVRKEVILQMSNDINVYEEELISKDYNYYKSYGYFK